jgi:hypothetical protein
MTCIGRVPKRPNQEQATKERTERLSGEGFEKGRRGVGLSKAGCGPVKQCTGRRVSKIEG